MSAGAALRQGVRRFLGDLRNASERPVMVLLYHRVAALEHDPQQLAVSPERFLEQLRTLKARMPVVRFDQVFEAERRPAAAITFDDGYADNLHQALPLLERMATPATFFITTGNAASGREYWWDELERVLLRPARLPERFELSDPELGGAWPAGTAAERERLYVELHARMKRVDAARRDEWMAALRAWAGDDGRTRESHRPLTVEELRALARSPWVTIGAHAVSHAPLAALDAAGQRAEIEGSRRTLEEWLGREVATFSYPFGGAADIGRHAPRLCRELGYRLAAVNRPGVVRSGTSPYRVPRHLVRDWDGARFGRELWDFLRW